MENDGVKGGVGGGGVVLGWCGVGGGGVGGVVWCYGGWCGIRGGWCGVVLDYVS
ncbi:hypothetical protein Hamer_G008415 [Homarus americanus]|uniref:Uncharacterized protein n=1 Tax=Homarus americanus TaxID=6706 RepID=A0A8J5NEC7_HOMAM|nr:hypothetical protein Hamer_G008415 [Homarus americanus]